MSLPDYADTAPIANPTDYGFNRTPMPLYCFQFGAYGATFVYAWGCHSLEAALEEAAGWLATNEPGHFHEPEYDESAAELGAPEDWRTDDEWCDKVRDAAEVDLTYTESGYLASWEWTLVDVTDTGEIEHVLWRSREGADPDDDDYMRTHADGTLFYAFDPDGLDCQGADA